MGHLWAFMFVRKRVNGLVIYPHSFVRYSGCILQPEFFIGCAKRMFNRKCQV